MKRIWNERLITLLLVFLVAFMGAKLSTYSNVSTIDGDEKILVTDDPGGTPATRNMPVSSGSPNLASHLASTTQTLTNKTLDADNNTVSNLDIGNEVDWAAAGNVSDRSAFASGDKLLIFEDGVGLRKIDYDDIPAGGSSLSNFTEAESTASPNGTVYVDSLTAAGASTNADVSIIPKGTGALLSRIPDNTSAGGLKRGSYAVDFQRVGSQALSVALGDFSVLTGGEENIIGTGTHNVISGGDTNTASYPGGNNYTTIGGGYGNSTDGEGSTVSGGLLNNSIGQYSYVPGGYYGRADLYGQGAHAAGNFSSSGDAQVSELVARNQTTDATTTELFLDGSSERCTIDSDTSWMFTISIVARRTDADNESAMYKVEGGIDNNAGTTALVGSVTKTVIAEDTAAWDVTVTADNTNNALTIDVDGEGSKTINWVAKIELTEVSG